MLARPPGAVVTLPELYSKPSIVRYLNMGGIKNYRRVKVPFLSKANKKRRLVWVRDHANFDFSKVFHIATQWRCVKLLCHPLGAVLRREKILPLVRWPRERVAEIRTKICSRVHKELCTKQEVHHGVASHQLRGRKFVAPVRQSTRFPVVPDQNSHQGVAVHKIKKHKTPRPKNFHARRRVLPPKCKHNGLARQQPGESA